MISTVSILLSLTRKLFFFILCSPVVREWNTWCWNTNNIQKGNRCTLFKSAINIHLQPTNLRTPQRVFLLMKAFSLLWLAPISRKGCSRKAASMDKPAELWVGKPESHTRSGLECPGRWLTGRATSRLESWLVFPAALGRKRLRRGVCRQGWGWPTWRQTEPCEKKTGVKCFLHLMK